MMPKYVTMLKIGSTIAKQSRSLGTTADSPLEYLNNQLYKELGISEGYIAQLLACDEQHRGELKSL